MLWPQCGPDFLLVLPSPEKPLETKSLWETSFSEPSSLTSPNSNILFMKKIGRKLLKRGKPRWSRGFCLWACQNQNSVGEPTPMKNAPITPKKPKTWILNIRLDLKKCSDWLTEAILTLKITWKNLGPICATPIPILAKSLFRMSSSQPLV